jgi:cell shape-determining protein MreC
MRRPSNRIRVFIAFLTLSILIFIFSQHGWLNLATGFLQSLTIPIQRYSQNAFNQTDGGYSTSLQKENTDLRTQLVKLKALEKDNQALRDQFKITNPSPQKLLPAYIISAHSSLPGSTEIDTVHIDKGSMDNVRVGNKVIYTDNVVGRVVKISPRIAVVQLLNHKNFSETAQTSQAETVGILKGTGDKKMTLNNISLTDIIHPGDTVITRDPQPLVIGKIISVNKKSSALFQSAEVQSLINIKNLKIVFVLLNN